MSTSENLILVYDELSCFFFHILSSEVFVFQTKDNGIHRQKEHLTPSLVLYFGNYESSNLRIKYVRNFQLVLSWLSLYREETSQK